MPDIGDVFTGATLKATDLGPLGSKVVVQISGVEPVEFTKKDGSPDPKLRISFVGKNKTMICNQTNAKTIAKYYGTDYDGWIGKKITLEHALVEFGPKEVSGIRVPRPTTNIKPSATISTGRVPVKESENPAEEMIDDEIPF